MHKINYHANERSESFPGPQHLQACMQTALCLPPLCVFCHTSSLYLQLLHQGLPRITLLRLLGTVRIQCVVIGLRGSDSEVLLSEC